MLLAAGVDKEAAAEVSGPAAVGQAAHVARGRPDGTLCHLWGGGGGGYGYGGGGGMVVCVCGGGGGRAGTRVGGSCM